MPTMGMHREIYSIASCLWRIQLPCHSRLPLCCMSYWTLSIHHVFCLSWLLLPDMNVASAFAGNLESSVRFACQNHCTCNQWLDAYLFVRLYWRFNNRKWSNFPWMRPYLLLDWNDFPLPVALLSHRSCIYSLNFIYKRCSAVMSALSYFRGSRTFPLPDISAVHE